jgi:UDPglucose--hexose-1-phosphate uridylyltransferase
LTDIRQDPVSGHRVIYAPDRAKRPNDFAPEQGPDKGDDRCPFCPGNESETPPEVFSLRQSGEPDTPGWDVRVVRNKYPALSPETGAHEVIIETPNHDASLADMPVAEVRDVVLTWQMRIRHHQRDASLRAVSIFKNHGAAAGATRAHPHTQLMALPYVPPRIESELSFGRREMEVAGECPWCRSLESAGERLVFETEHFGAIVPKAARFPFETWVIPWGHASNFETLAEPMLTDFARVLASALHRINTVLDNPPFNAVLLTAPFSGTPAEEQALRCYHWRMELIPRLSTIAGFEWGTGCFINAILPEEASRRLRLVEMD